MGRKDVLRSFGPNDKRGRMIVSCFRGIVMKRRVHDVTRITRIP